jgi:hypothetical protein
MRDSLQPDRVDRTKFLTVAISYRRTDSAEVAAQIYRRLCLEYGRDDVLFDIESIPLGVDFRRYIDQSLQIAKIVLAVIGKDWLGSSGLSQINDETDFVRLELEAALRRNIIIVPIFIDGAKPARNDLPKSLRELEFRNGVNISSQNIEAGLNQLVHKIDELLPIEGSSNTSDKPASFYGDSKDSYHLGYIDQNGFDTTKPIDKPVAAVLKIWTKSDSMLLISGQPVETESTFPHVQQHLSLTNISSVRVMLLAFTLHRTWLPWWRWTRKLLDVKACDVRMTIDSSEISFRCNRLENRVNRFERFIDVATDDSAAIEIIFDRILQGTDSLVRFEFINLGETANFHFGRIRQVKAIEEVLSF